MTIFQQVIHLSILITLSCNSFSQTVVEVPGSSDWVPTGVIRASSDELVFCSGGEVRGWPETDSECWRWVTPSGIGRPNFTSTAVPCPSCPVLSLIAKIGESGIPFYLGDRCVVQPSVTSATGEIFLRINDSSLNDNSGLWQVAISKNCSDLSDCFSPPIPNPGTVQISGTSNWTATGITRNAGEEVIFCGKGEIKAWGPLETECWRVVTPAGLGRYNFTSNSTPCVNCPVLSLIGKIGENGIPFYVGNRGVIQPSDLEDGEIFLRINDASLTDNSGEWAVSIVKDCNEITDCFTDQIVSTKNSEINNIASISVFPNPTEDKVNIEVQLNKQADITVRVFELSGKMIKTEDFRLNSGSHSINLLIPQNINNGLIVIQTILADQTYSNLIMVK